MKDKQKILQSILRQGMLPLFYWDNPLVSLEIVRALYEGGVRAIEYTNRGRSALENFKLIKRTMAIEAPDLYMGIGTIKNAGEAETFIHEANADFVVSPIFSAEIADVADKADVLWVPGCMTPTEISNAQEHGAALIKIFPAGILGHEYLLGIRDLFPGQLFMPTGGVELTEENVKSWFRAGVCAIGIGGNLVTKDILRNENYALLTKHTALALAMIETIRELKG